MSETPTRVEIVPYQPQMAAEIAAGYSQLVRSVPHCYAVSGEALAVAVDPAATLSNHDGVLCAQAGFVARQGGAVRGSVHVAVAHPADADQPQRGAIRLLWYHRGHRRAGQALLEAAQTYLSTQGMARIEAGRYQHRVPFYHLPHALLSSRLGHIQALLGLNGYRPFESEVVLDWPDYPPTPPAPVDLPFETALSWAQVPRGRPRLIVRALQGEETIGICVCASGAEETGAPGAQEWVYVRWLWVAEGARGHGLARHLLRRGFLEMHQAGYRHAAICTLEDNYPAFLLYSNLGYRAVDWTHSYARET